MGPFIQLRACSYHAGIQDPHRVTVTRTEQLTEMVRRLQAAPVMAADTETSGLRWDLDSRVVGYSWTVFDGHRTQSYYLPFRHLTGEAQIPEDLARRVAWDVFTRARPDQLRVWWNRKFDDHMVRKEGLALTWDRDICAMLASRLYDENTSAALKHRALVDLGEQEAHLYEEILSRETIRLASLNGLKKEEYTQRYGYSQIPIYMAGQYACRDTEYTLWLFRKYCEAGVMTHYGRSPRGPGYLSLWDTEQQLARVLCDTEEWGYAVDRSYFAWLRDETAKARERLEQEIWDEIGHHRRFNLDSDDELRWFIQNVLQLQLHKVTRGGELAVDREVLEELEPEAKILRKIRDRREAHKINTTYTDSLLQWVGHDGFLHGNYQQMQADTGRASCTQPNLQNITSDSDARAVAATGKKLEQGGKDPWSIRQGFPRRPGYVRVLIDWSQIELRVLADESRDPNLIEAYRNAEDLHDKTTKLIFGTVTKEKRRVSKMANFGTSFGLTAMGLARRAKIPLEEAEDFMRRFGGAYPGIPALRERLVRETIANGGWFSNKYGRTRRVPQIMIADERERARAERQIIASKIQGSAADMAKVSMVRIGRWLEQERLETRIVGWIHDEIQFDVPPQEFAYVVPRAKAIMEDFPDCVVPIVAEADYTLTNWSEKKKVPGLK